MALSMLSRSTRSTRRSGLHLVLPMRTTTGDSATVNRAKSLRRKSISITQNNSATMSRSNRRVTPEEEVVALFWVNAETDALKCPRDRVSGAGWYQDIDKVKTPHLPACVH